MKSKWLKTVCAAFTAAALTVSFGSAMVMADSTEDELNSVIEEVDLDDFGLAGSYTSEVHVTGAIPNGDSTLALDAQITAVNDQTAGKFSVDGTVNVSGISIDLGAYLDEEKVMLQIPMLPNILSYNYTADPEGTTLAQMVGPEVLEYINKVIQLSYATTYQTEAFQQYAQELMNAIQEIASGITMEQADAKDFTIGGATVSCPGMKTVITKEFASDAVKKLLGVNLPNGQTFEEYINMIMDFSDEANGYDTYENDVVTEIDSFFADMPDMELAVYMQAEADGTVSDYPVAVELSAEGTVVSLQFLGEYIPYTDIRLYVDGQEQFSVVTEITADGAIVTVSQEGEVLGSVELGMDGDNAVATLTVQGEVIGTLTIMETGEFTISSQYLPSDITGQFSMEDDAMVIKASFMGFDFESRVYAGGSVTVPEGDVIELTEISQEDAQQLVSLLGSLFSGFSGSMSQAA